MSHTVTKRMANIQASDEPVTAPLMPPDIIARRINGLLQEFYAGQIKDAEALDPGFSRLWSSIQTLGLQGGKRLRPYVTMLAYTAYGGTDTTAMLRIAAAQEVIHLCMLVHDDIIDRDLVRYGIPNIAGQYHRHYTSLPAADRDHFSMSAALLAGDLLLSAAYQFIFESGLPAADILTAQRFMQKSIFEVTAGELLDVESTIDTALPVDPLKISRLKTASYSFVGPLACGASLAHAPEDAVAAMRQVGFHFGVAFQMADDILGVFGDTALTGKSTTGDLEEGKQTMLLQETLRRVRPADAQRIQTLIGRGSISQADAEYIRSSMVDSGAKAYVESSAQHHIETALAVVQSQAIPQSAQQAFSELAAKLVGRKV